MGGGDSMGGGDPVEKSNPSGDGQGPIRGGASAADKKVVVVMGATGAGKSKLAIDLASHIPGGIEIVNADSMQVYRGLDVLTNKVPLSEQQGVPHHLLGSIDASLEFTSKEFRDLAAPIIDDILARGCLPVIVGGTNYYIQALVSPFLVDDMVEDMDGCSLSASREWDSVDLSANYERLKEIDPVSANRIHPNDHRKINRYSSLCESLGVLPSNLFQGKGAKKWGRPDNFRYSCCFIWVDASLAVLDKFVDQRVDHMIAAGLLNEVHDMHKPNTDYTRGLMQAIGVREFEEFFGYYFANKVSGYACLGENRRANDAKTSIPSPTNEAVGFLKPNFLDAFYSDDSKLKTMLGEAIDKLKANTRKLVRRQRRRLNRLKTYFGWDLHYLDATSALYETLTGDSGDAWLREVVQPCVHVVEAFLVEKVEFLMDKAGAGCAQSENQLSRDLWTQHICEACGHKILRGAHEWEEHKRGRAHRKRILGLKKKNLSSNLAIDLRAEDGVCCT